MWKIFCSNANGNIHVLRISTLHNSGRCYIHNANWLYRCRLTNSHDNTVYIMQTDCIHICLLQSDCQHIGLIQSESFHWELLTRGGVAFKEQKWDFGMIRECLGNKENIKYNKQEKEWCQKTIKDNTNLWL